MISKINYDFLKKEKNELIEDLYAKPFSNIINYKNKLLKAEKIYHESAQSWEVFKITDWENTYKLRICESEKKAKRIDTNSKKLKNILPDYYGREWKYLLYKRISNSIEYHQYKWPNKNYKLWEILWQANQYRKDRSKEDFEEVKSKHIKRISKAIKTFSPEEQIKILEKINILFDPKENNLWLDLIDAHTWNLLFDQYEHLYFIDEEGISGREIIGLWMAKLIRNWRINVEWFFSWYRKHCSFPFTKEYLEGLFLLMTLKRYAKKLSDRENNKHNLPEERLDFTEDNNRIKWIINNDRHLLKETSLDNFISYVEKENLH